MHKKNKLLSEKNVKIIESILYFTRLISIPLLCYLLFIETYLLFLLILLISSAKYLVDIVFELKLKKISFFLVQKDFFLEISLIISILIILIIKKQIGVVNTYLIFAAGALFTLFLIAHYIKTGAFMFKDKTPYLISWIMFMMFFYLISFRIFFADIFLFLTMLVIYFYTLPKAVYSLVKKSRL